MENSRGNAQITGCRLDQQDAFGWTPQREDNLTLAVIADGMGGLKNGALAAQTIVSTILNGLPAALTPEQIPITLEQLTDAADRLIHDKLPGSGSTVCILAVLQNKMWWATVGDSMMSLYRNGKLYKINRFHDAQTEALRHSLRTGKAAVHTQAQGLTSYLGMGGLANMELAHTGFVLQPGDCIMLCTDGVYRTLTEQFLQEALRLPAQQSADIMIEEIAHAGLSDQDNATVLVYHFDEKR